MVKYKCDYDAILPYCEIFSNMFLFFLIECQRDIKETNDCGQTSLICSSMNSNIPLAKLIISIAIDGVDINAKLGGKTALEYEETKEMW